MSTGSTNTDWQRGRLDGRAGPGQVLFGRMYEDSAIELEAFQPGSRILCIASAGCTAMKLAPRHDVVAVDINPVQLAYAQRRLAGGPSERGRAEQIMNFMRFFGPLAGWWPSRVRGFVELDDLVEQQHYWEQHLNTRRFRGAVDGLFSLTALRSVYGQHFLQFLPKHLGAVLRGRMERCFRQHPNRSNPFARALLVGDLATEQASERAGEVTLVQADVADFLERQAAGSFDSFSLSNILDGSEDAYRQRLFAAVRHAGSRDAIAVLRSFSEADADSSANRAASDRSMLWGSVLVQPVGEL